MPSVTVERTLLDQRRAGGFHRHTRQHGAGSVRDQPGDARVLLRARAAGSASDATIHRFTFNRISVLPSVRPGNVLGQGVDTGSCLPRAESRRARRSEET